MIISVGYRVKSHRGTQFRIWATQRLREYIVKGFTLDDERLKRAGGGNYFDELLARIRDIRSSEKVFWRKVLEIYATSIDYDPRGGGLASVFFKTVQNKMHWAAHGHTAAEVIAARADATKPNMGLTTWTGGSPEEGRRRHREELPRRRRARGAQSHRQRLPRVRGASGDEPQADVHGGLDRQARRLPEALGARDLRHAGKVAHEDAVSKAELEYDRFAGARAGLPSPVEDHFEDAVREVAEVAKARRATLPGKRPDRGRKPKS